MHKLSVVLAVYNGEPYLTDTIESILGQSFSDFEFIIVNDGSTDRTAEILENFAANDERIRVVHQENSGVTLATRAGCDLACGEYIARTDADDLSTPGRFEKQIAVLDNDPQLVAVTGDVEHFTNEGRVLTVAKLHKDPRLIRFYNCFRNHIGGHGQVMFRRDAYEKVGGYDPSFRFALDYDLWARLLLLGDFGNVPEIIYRYRTGHDNISSCHRDEQEHHSLRTTLREYERMTGEQLNEHVARILRNFWWYRPPLTGLGNKNSAASDAMQKVAKVFFKQNPDLRCAQYVIYRDIAAKWYWWSMRVPPYSADRAIYLFEVLSWGMRAIAARLRYGAGS